MNNLVTRTLSGAVFIAIVAGAILWNPLAYVGVFLAVVIWSLLEFYDIIIKDRVHASKFTGILCGAVLFVAGFFYAQGIVSGEVFLVFIPLLVILFIAHLYSAEHNSFRGVAYTITGVVYIALPFSLCNGLVYPHHDTQYVKGILLGFFILLWINDTFAYLTGIVFGKHRLFERISPKKSWEGFFGGLLFTIAFSLPVTGLFPVLPYYHWMAIAAITSIFGVYGDLLESMLKRNLKIKDSGRFLPGHGGILDRFDAVLLAAPVVFFYLEVFVL